MREPMSAIDSSWLPWFARVATGLGRATSVEEVGRTLISSICPSFADMCEVVLLDASGELRRIGLGPDEQLARARAPIPDLEDHPLRAVTRTGVTQVLHVDDPVQEHLFGPVDMPGTARALGVRAAVVAPLIERATPIGALGVAVIDPSRDLTAEHALLVENLGKLAGTSIANIRASERQQALASGLRSAAAMGALLAEATDTQTILSVLNHDVRETLGADRGAVYLLQDGVLVLADSVGYDDDLVATWRSVGLDADVPVAEVVRGRAHLIWLSGLDAVVARYPVMGSVPGFADHSMIAVRMPDEAGVVGAAFWAFDDDRHFAADDRTFVELVARQAAGAIRRTIADERMRGAEREAVALTEQLQVNLARQREIAQILQSSLLPREVPAVPGCDVSVEYWPSMTDMDVGGDFYDVFEVGRDMWALAIGDVCGKGPNAAALTATARHAMRAAATHIRDPALVLNWVHEAVRADPSDSFCSLAFAQLDPQQRRLTTVLGGHPPGIRVDEQGVVTRLGELGTVLGVTALKLHPTTTELSPCDLVVFFTDGITDAPPDEAMPEDELIALLAAHHGCPLPAIGQRIRAALDARRPAGDRDDVALLMLRVGNET
jgi:serine phosphatase RsbU (regulator of sigma subunit)